MNTKYLWVALNTALMSLAVLAGYNSMNPEKLRHTNPGPILCLIVLFITPLFAIGSVAYAVRRSKIAQLKRASWSRNPFNWWRDPLQSLFVSTCVVGAMAIGSLVHRPAVGSVGFWTLGVYSCFTIGLLLGQVLVFRIHQQQIASN